MFNAGGPTMNLRVAMSMENSVKKATGLGLLIIIILLAVLFRRLSGVLLPLLVVVLSMLMTLALWPVLGYAFNSNTSIIPTFILAVGIADAIHILTIFYRHYDNGTEKNEAIRLAVRQTAIAVLLTTVTTAVGLLSFLASSLSTFFNTRLTLDSLEIGSLNGPAGKSKLFPYILSLSTIKIS